jgi:hypothetical protein
MISPMGLFVNLLGGVLPDRVYIIRACEDALQHVKCYCRNRHSDYEVLIHSRAKVNGLPKRVGEKQARISHCCSN